MIWCVENNLALQEKLYGLRNETQDAFNEAKALEASWADLEKEQRDVYQVCLQQSMTIDPFTADDRSAFHAAVSAYASSSCHNRTR